MRIMYIYRRYFYSLLLFSSLLFIVGCEDYFTVNPDDILLEKDYPSTITELYSGYMGIAAKTQEIADQAIFLEGLRSDFLEPTENSSKEIIDLYLYKEDGKNELANPKGYYNIILGANDFFKHIEIFIKNNPTAIDQKTFDALVGGALRYKVWSYFMLAKLYGQAVWIDEPFSKYEDLNQYKLLNFDQILDKCIDVMENGIDLNGKKINGKGKIRWSNVLFPGVGDSPANLQWNRICPEPEPLLAELYIFKGEYELVIKNCLDIIRQGGDEQSYQLNKSEWNGEWIDLFRDFVRREAIFMFTYDYNLKQTNRLISYFSNQSPNQYLLRPSDTSMQRFRDQKRSDGTDGDIYRGEGRTFAQNNGQWVVNKFISAHTTSDKVFRNDVVINLYRASDLYLWMVEALNHLGRFEEALIFLNGGIETYFNTASGVFMSPFEQYPTTLYRTTSTSEGANQGIRGRVSLKSVGDEILQNPSANIEDDKFKIDSLLIEETFLECAGEARSLFTLIRMAKRWNKPEIVANNVSEKYPAGTKEDIKTKLLDSNNWFIKYDLQLDK